MSRPRGPVAGSWRPSSDAWSGAISSAGGADRGRRLRPLELAGEGALDDRELGLGQLEIRLVDRHRGGRRDGFRSQHRDLVAHRGRLGFEIPLVIDVRPGGICRQRSRICRRSLGVARDLGSADGFGGGRREHGRCLPGRRRRDPRHHGELGHGVGGRRIHRRDDRWPGRVGPNVHRRPRRRGHNVLRFLEGGRGGGGPDELEVEERRGPNLEAEVGCAREAFAGRAVPAVAARVLAARQAEVERPVKGVKLRERHLPLVLVTGQCHRVGEQGVVVRDEVLHSAGERANASESPAAPGAGLERVPRAAAFAEQFGQDLGHRAPVYARPGPPTRPRGESIP